MREPAAGAPFILENRGLGRKSRGWVSILDPLFAAPRRPPERGPDGRCSDLTVAFPKAGTVLRIKTLQKFSALFRACLFASLGVFVFPAWGQGLLPSPSREIKVLDIRVEGNKTVDKSLILKSVQVEKGRSYILPVLRNKLRESVNALDKLNLFSNIRVDEDRSDSLDGVILYFVVAELPTLARVEYKGLDELKVSDFKGKIDLVDGQVYSPGAVEVARQKILDLYHEKGYLLAQVKVEESEDKETARKIITFDIKEGKKVTVRYITFDGNTHVPDKVLRQHFNTKEDRWWRSGDFKEDEYRFGLDSLVDFYQGLGYLDAAVLSDSIRYTPDKRHLDIRIRISEGKRYYFDKIHFIHDNSIIKEQVLRAQVLFDSGEVFDKHKYDLMKYQITNLYREEGYLFVDLNDRFEYHDSLVEVTFNIQENSLAHIHLVNISGNTKTKDKVIRREIKLFPGDTYRQSLMMRSQRDIMQLAYFDDVEPDIERPNDGDPSDVNLVFKVKEKEAGTGTFSAGAAYSGRDGLVGTLGVQIPNFMGNGQTVNASTELGPYKTAGSFGFTEPWFMDTPTSVGGSVSYTDQRPQPGIIENEYRSEGFHLNLGRRLTWPDDYYTLQSGYNFSFNDNGQGRNQDYLIVASGLESSVNLTLIRDDKDLPFFPTEGSRYKLSYTKVGGGLGGDFNYGQWDAKMNWWFPTIGKLVLGMESEFGIILGNTIQSYALYQMGGELGYVGKLRGYEPGTIGGDRVGRSFFSYVTELTYPVVPNTFYLLGFFDAGNVFGNLVKYDPNLGTGYFNSIPKSEAPSPWSEIDFSDLRRDVGFGFRVVVPMVAPFGMGFDFAWPLDDLEDYSGRRYPPVGASPQVQFTIEQGF